MKGFRERINEGLSGQFQGLNNGLKRINDVIFGIQRSCYTVIGGASGSGKSFMVDFMLINAIKNAVAKNIPINCFYYSLEIDETTKQCNWISALIHSNYGVIINPERIKGLGNNRLTKDEQEMVNATIPELEEIWNKIHWVFEAPTPTGVYKTIWAHMSNRGTFEYEPYKDENGEEKQRIVKYINNNPNEYNMVVIDHIGLLRVQQGITLKDNIDKMSILTVRLRNLFGITAMYLQQFNDGLSSIDRRKFSGVDVSPSMTDARDSKNTYIDCDCYIGLMNAHRMELEECLGYSISAPNYTYQLKSRFVMMKIMKNRLSRDGVAIGLLFIPEAGGFEELPRPHQITKEWSDRINKLNERK